MLLSLGAYLLGGVHVARTLESHSAFLLQFVDQFLYFGFGRFQRGGTLGHSQLGLV